MGLLKQNSPISGCSVYWMKNGVVVPGVCCKDDVTISLPSLEFESLDMNMMGTFSLPDPTRLGNLQLSLNMNLDDDDARKFAMPGILQEWKIVWFAYSVDKMTGAKLPEYWEVYAKGYVTSIPNGEISVGSENKGDITMNLLSITKKRQGVSVPLDPSEYTIDRLTNTVRIGGVDLASPSKKLMISI